MGLDSNGLPKPLLQHARVHLLSLAKVCIIQFTLVFQLSRRASLNFTLKFFSASSSDLPSAKESFGNDPETLHRYHLFQFISNTFSSINSVKFLMNKAAKVARENLLQYETLRGTRNQSSSVS